MSYIAEYKIPYEGGYVDLPSEETPEMAEFINKRDDTLLKIEKYLSELDLSGLGGDYALLSEAGYSINVSIDENYILTISLLNKEGMTLSTRTIDLPIESMVVNASYESGKLILTLQNGQTIEVDISEIARGLVPTSRKIAGIDLEDDITASELQEALGVLDNAHAAGEIKPYLYKENEETLCGVYMGKPLYRIVLWISSLANNGKSTIPVSQNIEKVLRLEGYVHFSDGEVISLESTRRDASENTMGFVLRYTKSINSVVIQSFRDRTTSGGLVIIEYTKTTDDVGSGDKLNPYGIYDAKIDEIEKSINNDIITTSDDVLIDSVDGGLLFNVIKGVSTQDSIPYMDSPKEIKKSVISEIKTHDGSGNECAITLSEPIILNGIDDVHDVIQDGKVKRRFAEIVYNGSENWTREVTGLGFVRFYRGITDSLNVAQRSKIFSTHFRYSSGGATDGEGVYAFYNGRIHLYANFDTVADFKAWLATNNVTVVYPLAEETVETIPISDRIAINNLLTFQGTTHLEFESEINPIFECEYGTNKVGGYTLKNMLKQENSELNLTKQSEQINVLLSKIAQNTLRINELEKIIVNNV